MRLLTISGAVLAVLDRERGPMTAREAATRTGEMLNSVASSLRQLTGEGYVRDDAPVFVHGVTRRRYSITRAGRTRLAAVRDSLAPREAEEATP